MEIWSRFSGLSVISHWKYSGKIKASFSTSACFSNDLGIMLYFIDPTSSRIVAAPSPEMIVLRSSSMVSAMRRAVSAFNLRVLKISAAVTASD
jgi:L-lactate utilization protein LutC